MSKPNFEIFENTYTYNSMHLCTIVPIINIGIYYVGDCKFHCECIYCVCKCNRYDYNIILYYTREKHVNSNGTKLFTCIININSTNNFIFKLKTKLYFNNTHFLSQFKAKINYKMRSLLETIDFIIYLNVWYIWLLMCINDSTSNTYFIKLTYCSYNYILQF